MIRVLAVRNRQSAVRIDCRGLRARARCLLEELLGLTSYSLCIHLVGPVTSARVNWQFLRHEGPTDVITFDTREAAEDPPLCGELFICIAEAVRQARTFGTTWQEETVRYVVHGVLHLQGYDDRDAGSRRVMKRMEARLLRGVVPGSGRSAASRRRGVRASL
jgi:probable rRNA maturation factor